MAKYKVNLDRENPEDAVTLICAVARYLESTDFVEIKTIIAILCIEPCGEAD